MAWPAWFMNSFVVDTPDEPHDDTRKSIELGFDTVKQLTTLSAGSSVLVATFPKDIFSDDEGNLAIDAFETTLIGASFVCFGATLLASVLAMWLFGVMRRMLGPFERQRVVYAVYGIVSTSTFVTGIGTFVWAVWSDLQP